jgi:hypothetical protein
MPGTAEKSTARRFTLVRDEDVSGTSGLGVVAEGIEWSHGKVSLHWLSQLGVVSVYDNLKTVVQVHGHDGKTKVVWIDT